ncbi:Lysozyme [Candidatus Trichorickettsia mobilis]|uniref:Lysozyme n=2 Tax=Candidatus Trichorickettsia mobilis TaxID=1346319 RepID=A0ABZ0UZ49_9RICK|nr:Lysozyme [Candidatus Trichorickettsia mobilis]
MHRFTSSAGIALIKQFEGFSKVPYICAGGYYTIGYGHKLAPNEQYDSLSEETAEQILVSDLFSAERAVVRYIDVELLDYQFDALVSFTFNCGSGALQRSTLRQKINYQLYDEAGAEFLKWIYVGSRRITGLVYRRIAEKRLFTGILGEN